MDRSSDIFLENAKPALMKTFSASHDQEDTDIDTPLNSPARRSRPVPHLSSPTSAQQIAPKELASLGFTLDSLLGSTVQDRMRVIFNMQDAIRGEWQAYAPLRNAPSSGENSRVVVSNQDDHDLVVVAIDTLDRPGLLLDISKCLSRLHLDLHHTEAAVRHSRSLSIWRCEASFGMGESMAEIWSVIQSLVSSSGAEAMRQRGLQVLRARVRDGHLVGKTLDDIPDFREKYKAAIVAIQKADGRVYSQNLSKVAFDAGDLLVLQVNEDSPLCESPPEDFNTDSLTTRSSYNSFRNTLPDDSSAIDADVEIAKVMNRFVLNDLEVLKPRNDGSEAQREFLTAMQVDESSGLSGKTVAQAGIDKLPGLFLVSIDRPHIVPDSTPPIESFTSIPLTNQLSDGDVLWFSGSATAIGNLRKIPGLSLLESDEVMKMGEKAQDRRLVEAVVSRNGPVSSFCAF